MDNRNGYGWQGQADHESDDEARQAEVLSDLVDLLNAGAENAAALAERATANGDLRRLLTVARLLSVQPDLDAIERASARLRPWQGADPRPVPTPLASDAEGTHDAGDVGNVDALGAADSLPPSSPAVPAPRGVLEVTGLDHVALPVSDLERAVAFYRGVLGLPIVNESRTPPPPTTPHVDFAAGEARLLVYQALGSGEAAPRKALGGELQFPHVALRLAGAAPVLARLRASGHPFDGPIPSGAGEAAVHLWDPDGNQIDLIVPWPEPAAR
jgi:glyoxylase I family protein